VDRGPHPIRHPADELEAAIDLVAEVFVELHEFGAHPRTVGSQHVLDPVLEQPLRPAAHATSQAREIVPGVTEGSARFETALAGCPSGTVAYGTGAAVPSIGRIGLQMTRTSGPLDISRATARADNNYSGSWTLTSYAICARPAGGLHAEREIAPGDALIHRCSNLTQVVAGPGGGDGLTDGG
jgi:hypothetical protein